MCIRDSNTIVYREQNNKQQYIQVPVNQRQYQNSNGQTNQRIVQSNQRNVNRPQINGQISQNKIYQSQQVNPINGSRFRQNSKKFQEVINRSAAFTFNTGSFKTGKKAQVNVQARNEIKTQFNQGRSNSPMDKKMFNSSIRMKPKKPELSEIEDHLEIDNFIMIKNKASGRRFDREIDLISDNIRRSQTPNKKRSDNPPLKSLRKPQTRKINARSVSPFRPVQTALPVMKKQTKRTSRKIQKQVVSRGRVQPKSNREVRVRQEQVKTFVQPQTTAQLKIEQKKKCNFNKIRI